MNIAWQEIDTLLLDMDGTLLDLHFDNYFWQHYLPEVYITRFNLDRQKTLASLHHKFVQYKGSMAWYSTDFWSQELQLDVAALKHDIKEKIAVRPFVKEFLAQSQKMGKQLILLTNAHRDSLNLKLQETQISPYFNAIVSTHDYGMPKEEQALWQAVQKDYAFEPERSLFIDDGEAILDSAKTFGIKHLLTLKQPDSKACIREGLRYPAILHFDEILPNAKR